MGLIDDYLKDVETTLRAGDPARKRQIVDELRAHLHDKLAEERARDPDAPEGEVARRVLADFGSARELALAYEPAGRPVLKNQAGEIVLRLGHALGNGARAVGRGTGRALKWFAIAMSALLVIALGLGVWAFYEVRPVVETLVAQSEPVFAYHESCRGTPCNGIAGNDSFYVANDTKEVRLSFDIAPPWRDTENATGNVRLLVLDPAGNHVLDRNFTLGNKTTHSQEMRVAPTSGNWTVTVEYDGFRGDVDLVIHAYAVRWADV